VDAIIEALEKRLGEAPAFFRGSDVRVAVESGPLATGCLAQLDELAARFDLRIIEVAAVKPAPVAGPEALPRKPNMAHGSAPNAFEDEAPTIIAAASTIAAIEYGRSSEPMM